MSASEFDIIFRGDIVFGHQLADVKLKLQQLFKVDAAKVDALFTGRPVPLKRKLDEATAHKYREVLLKAGAQVEISPSAAADMPAPKPTPRAAPSSTPSSTPVTTIAPAAPPTPPEPLWSIAPAGADLLPANQRPAAAPAVAVDLTGLSLRAQSGNLLDASEVAPLAVATVAVPDLEVADIGVLLTDDDHLPLPLVDIELEDWDIAEAGADLLREEERPHVVPVAIGPLDFALAPAGSDLGQLKPQVKPLNPDTSSLRLADPL